MQKIHVTKKILSVLLAVVLLCAVLPARVTGEEPALFRVALLYSDTTNAEGGSVKVALKLTSQDENDDSYNAYHFVLRYDSERLGYGAIATAGEAMPEIVEDSNGTLTIAGYGEQRIGQSFVVTFNVRAVGDAQVTLTEAYVDRGVNALKDARAAEIATNTVTIHAGGCAVELPDVEGIRQLGADSTILSTEGAAIFQIEDDASVCIFTPRPCTASQERFLLSKTESLTESLTKPA